MAGEGVKVSHYQRMCLEALMKYGIKADVPRGNPNYYLSFDPGEGTGWAAFSENGMPTDFGNVYGDVGGIADLLYKSGRFSEGMPKVIIYEKWKLLKSDHTFYGSTMLSVQVVGAIRAFAHTIGAELVSQETGINSTAQKWSGIKPEGSHSQSHWTYAFNHGWYYLQQNKLVIPRVLWPEAG